jgi:hypothetical protein
MLYTRVLPHSFSNVVEMNVRVGPVAQWIRHRSTEPEIVGSSPTRIIFSSFQARLR